MNSVTNQSLVAAFLAAKKYIANKSERFICLALDEAMLNGELDISESEAARLIVQRRISGCFTLEVWMSENIPFFVENDIDLAVNFLAYNDAILEYRLRWLDSLIAEFS